MIKLILYSTVLLLSVIFGFLYVKPEYDVVQVRQADLKILNETFKSTETMKDLVNQIRGTLNSIDPADTARARVFLPETIDEVRFANNLQSMGVTDGVVLADIKVGDKVKKIQTVGATSTVRVASTANVPAQALSENVSSGVSQQKTGAVLNEKKYTTTKASFSLITTYEKFIPFLNDLEKSLGLINITAVSFEEYNDVSSAKSLGKGSPVYQYKVELETYSLKK